MIHVISQSTGQSVRRICQSLQVPRSSYYHAATPTESQRGDAELGAAISTIFGHHRRRYGYRRIWKQLAADGLVCAPDRVRRLMQEQGLRAIQPKTYVPQTSDGRADLPSPNLLLHQPLPALPNQVWAGDITFIPSGEKWLYLAVVIDLCSRRIVGWALADHLRSDLVVAAMQQAIVSRRHINGLIFHSDRGSQYGSSAFRQVLQRAGMRQSMSARANPYHNAWTESFMGTLKAEMLQNGRFLNATDARTEIFAFIDCYYNTQRLHSSSNTEHPTTSRPLSPSQTKSLLVQLSVASQKASRGSHGFLIEEMKIIPGLLKSVSDLQDGGLKQEILHLALGRGHVRRSPELAGAGQIRHQARHQGCDYLRDVRFKGQPAIRQRALARDLLHRGQPLVVGGLDLGMIEDRIPDKGLR